MIRRQPIPADGAVHVVTIDRPERANALDAHHWSDLADAIRVGSDQGARCVVLTGAGRTFCAGGDFDEPDYDALLAACEDVMAAILEVPVPVVAYVNGPAIGAGLQLAVTCDLRVASPTARFSFPAAAISRPAHPSVIARLAARAGTGAATAMLIGGRALDAERAYQVGLVEELGEFEHALAWADTIARSAPLVLEWFKRELTVRDADGEVRYREFLGRLLASADYAEAKRAREDQRPPQFTGR